MFDCSCDVQVDPVCLLHLEMRVCCVRDICSCGMRVRNGFPRFLSAICTGDIGSYDIRVVPNVSCSVKCKPAASMIGGIGSHNMRVRGRFPCDLCTVFARF
ncbi:unnamed protein product [Ixodes pacificus]